MCEEEKTLINEIVGIEGWNCFEKLSKIKEVNNLMLWFKKREFNFKIFVCLLCTWRLILHAKDMQIGVRC
jgi:hypothetical protein